MKFTAEIQIIPLPEVVEPQGRTLQKHIHQLPIEGINQVRVGKFIILQLVAESETAAHDIVTKACEKLLVHPLVETYSFSLKAAEDSEFEAPVVILEEEEPEAPVEDLPAPNFEVMSDAEDSTEEE